MRLTSIILFNTPRSQLKKGNRIQAFERGNHLKSLFQSEIGIAIIATFSSFLNTIDIRQHTLTDQTLFLHYQMSNTSSNP